MKTGHSAVSREPELLAYPDACLCARLSMVALRRAIADGLIKVRVLSLGGKAVRMVERHSLEAFAQGPEHQG